MSKMMFAALLALASLLVATPSDIQAWGVAHTGYTHVGVGGVQHYGHTTAVGPYGAYSGGHAGAYGYGGASYHAGSAGAVGYGGAAVGGYHYGTTGYGGAYGGASYGAAGYGAYRRW